MAEQYGIHDLTENFTSPLEVMVEIGRAHV